jgi:IS30 family transposase
MKTYKHLTIEERETIQLMLWEKKSIRKIAKKLNRSPSSVSREIKKNISGRNIYTPRSSHSRALEKRKSRGRKNRLKNDLVRSYVVSRLKQKWSPEQISGRIRIDLNQTISHEAIYQYIYHQIHRQGCGYVKPNCEDLRIYLRRKRKRRIRKGARRCQRIFKSKGTSIDERPEIVNERKRIGDWESDSVESKDHKPGINTLVERQTGLVLISKLFDKTSKSTTTAIVKRLNYLSLQVKQTITFDNGTENSNWSEIERKTNAKTYFCNPYRSWERGTNENTNGLIREYFPKKTDFTTIPDREIKRVEIELNNRPRKRLNYKTPLEAFSVALRG